MKYIRLFEDFQLGDLNVMSPEEIQDLFFEECKKQTPDLELIKVILDNGLVDVNSKGYKDRSPLHYAAYRNNEAIVKLLISAGADVNAKDNGGNSPLHWAVSMGYEEMQALLKKHGAVE